MTELPCAPIERLRKHRAIVDEADSPYWSVEKQSFDFTARDDDLRALAVLAFQRLGCVEFCKLLLDKE